MVAVSTDVVLDLSVSPLELCPEESGSPSEEVTAAVSSERGEPCRWQSPRVVKQIGAIAKRWSLDNPDLREDLFQEGWLAAWQAEVENPDLPPNHLVRIAEQRILWVRRLGRSVDGKANPTHDRPVVYQVNSLDVRTRASDGRPCSLHELVPSRQRDVADHVLSCLHAAAFLTSIQALDQRILGLRLAGYRWAEVTQLIPMNPRALHARRRALRDDAKRHWDPERHLPNSPDDPRGPAADAGVARETSTD